MHWATTETEKYSKHTLRNWHTTHTDADTDTSNGGKTADKNTERQ